MTYQILLPPAQVNQLKNPRPVPWPEKFLSALSTTLAQASLINAGVIPGPCFLSLRTDVQR